MKIEVEIQDDLLGDEYMNQYNEVIDIYITPDAKSLVIEFINANLQKMVIIPVEILQIIKEK